MRRVFISNLDLAPGRACAHVFRCYGYEIYGTVQDDDYSQPAPAEAHKIIPRPTKNYQEFQQGILSCSVVIYDMSNPTDAITAFEVCAAGNNQRKFIALSTFMTWARTEIPDKIEEEQDPNLVEADDLPDEKAMEPQEVLDLYKNAKVTPPQWVIEKIKEIKRKERQEKIEELKAEGKLEEAEELEEKSEEDPLKPPEPEGEEKQEEEKEEEDQEDENPEPTPEELDEQLQKLTEYGIQEASFATRRPHPEFRETYEAENVIIKALQQAQNITGCIVTAGIIYGHGETVLTELFKRFYKQTTQKAPLYYGGHQRVLPFVHALDLALLIHGMCCERFPDKEAPFVFATERRHTTARQFAEALGMKILADDPKREEIITKLAKEKRETKPVPLTKQTYKTFLANYRKPVPVSKFVEEISKTETVIGKETVLELTQHLPMQLGFAATDVLEGRWPLFAREGVAGNLELAWSEFLHVWGLEPVRVFLQANYDISPQLGRELGEALSKYVGMGRDDGTNDQTVKSMIEAVGRQEIKEIQNEPETGEEGEEGPEREVILNEISAKSPIPVIDCRGLKVDSIIKKIVLTKSIRDRGWILINLPHGILPDDFFGLKAIKSFYEFYADTGLQEPKKRKKKAEDAEEEPPEEKEAPEWLKEDVEIDEEEKIKLIRNHILLPYTAPRNLFSFTKLGRARLAEDPKPKYEYYDGNICLEHPDGFRVPTPQFVIELPKIYRYEGDNERLKKDMENLDEKTLKLFREKEYEDQLRVRKEFVTKVKKQLIKIIAKKQEQDPNEFDEEGYNWTETYNLVGLDARFDLGSFPLKKKEGIPDDPEEPEQDEEGNPIEKPPKPINPDDYELGLEDVAAIVKRAQAQAARRTERKQRNADRKRRRDEGAEEVSEDEENSEPQVGENGEPLPTVPKQRPFLNVPRILDLEEIPEPTEHLHGYTWYMEIRGIGSAPLRPAAADKNGFTQLCLDSIRFLGPPRDFPASKAERAKAEQRKRLAEEVQRRVAEERALRAQEAARLAEEARRAELKRLRIKYEQDEERRVLELAVPLRKYIGGSVLSELLDGLIETARIRPADPVRFLGEYLLDRAVPDL